MSLTKDLISLIRHKPITPEDLQHTALFTLDALACAYAGCNTPVGEILKRFGAQGDMDNRRKALLMGALTHITETDDLHRASVTHPGCVVVPAVLALGEKLGSSPQQMLTAILQGFVEGSNVNPILQVSRMIEIQRAYEMGQSFLETDDQRIRNAVKTLIK